MKLSDYAFLYNATAYFAAREKFGGDEQRALDALNRETDEKGRKAPECKAQAAKLQAEINRHDLAALISTQTAEDFDALCWAVAELSTQAKLYNRNLGHEPRPLLTHAGNFLCRGFLTGRGEAFIAHIENKRGYCGRLTLANTY